MAWSSAPWPGAAGGAAEALATRGRHHCRPLARGDSPPCPWRGVRGWTQGVRMGMLWDYWYAPVATEEGVREVGKLVSTTGYVFTPGCHALQDKVSIVY